MYIFQISDLHFQLADERSVNNLGKVVKSIAEQDIQPDLLLMTGDIVHAQIKEGYAPVFESLKSLETPIYCITGNNDSSSGLIKALQEYLPQHPQSELAGCLQYCVEDYPFRLIGLDSFASGQMSGEMTDIKLAWLEEKLNNNPQHKPILLMIHQFTLPNALHRGFLPWFSEFNRIVSKHQDTVKLVVSGHVHTSISGQIGKTRFISADSVNWNSLLDFKEHGNQIKDLSAPVGYLIHQFNGDDFLTYHVAFT